MTMHQVLLMIMSAVAAQRQVPGGGYINYTGSRQAQVPGGPYVNEG